MKESGEWNPYYMCSPYGFCHEQRTFPWLYPYGNQMRLSEMYPIMAKRLQPYVEEICIQLEYPGSMMYDEYPDQLSLMKKSREIWKLAQEREQFGEAAPEWEQMQDLIGVLLLQEMLRRRKRQRMRGGSGILFGK